MRNRFAEVFYELAKDDSRINLLVADISPAGSIEKFRNEFPSRFINTGVAEQIMVGMAAGMAQRGLKPFIYTIATFALYRPFEFIRDDLCYQNLPVTIVGIGGGWTYSTLGATHHAQEDIAITSTLPNMNVIAPCDPHEVEYATRWCAGERSHNPTYLRLGKAGEPMLTANAIEEWRFGKIRKIVQGQNTAILTYGTSARLATEVHQELVKFNIHPSLYFASTLKPFDYNRLEELYSVYQTIVVIEEHISFGGLGMIVRAHAQAQSWYGKILTFTLPDDFSHRYGQHSEILSAVSMEPTKIVQSILKLRSL
jgi:transketolase